MGLVNNDIMEGLQLYPQGPRYPNDVDPLHQFDEIANAGTSSVVLPVVNSQMMQSTAPNLSPPAPLQIGRDGFEQAYREILKQNPIGANLAAFGSSLSDLMDQFGVFGDDDTTADTNKILRRAHPLSAAAGTYALSRVVPYGDRVPGFLAENWKTLPPAIAIAGGASAPDTREKHNGQ